MKRLQETIEAKRRPDVPRQLVIAFEAPQLWMMQPPERQRIVSSSGQPPDAGGGQRSTGGGRR